MTTLHEICHTITSWLSTARPQNPNWSSETWQQFKLVCRVHGVAPLLHEKLRGCDWLDPSLRIWLVGQMELNSQRIARMHNELQEILALFAQNGVKVMPLKGAILSVEFYEVAGWRPMADLDLLIHPQDFTHSAQLLARLGYEQDIAHWKHTEFIKPDNRRVVSIKGEHPDNPRSIEVHLHCRETFGGPTIELTDLMWGNAARGSLLGAPAHLPLADALWLHLLVHSTYHFWQGKGRLIYLVDMVRLGPHLSQPVTFLNAIEARFTYPSLVLLEKYFPQALDKTILASQRDRVAQPFHAWATGLDLVNSSHLNPNPAGLYLFKALKFAEGRPMETLQALRFAFLPHLAEIALDQPRLAASRWPWLAYFLLPLAWLKRLRRGR